MVFVNDLAGVVNLPAWMYHMPADTDAMTFVDVVFPAFLIIVGMSIPLAIQRRLDQGSNLWQLLQHIMIRSLGLIVLGVFMVNAEEMNVEENLIPKPVWNVLLYLSAILIWNQYPDDLKRRRFFQILQFIGIIILILLVFLFRKGAPGSLTGMTPSWWGILGLIGWAYLISTIIYLVFRNNLSATVAVFALLIIMSMGLMSPELKLPSFFAWLTANAGHVVHSSLVVSGIILTLLLQKGSASDNSGNTQLKWILVTGALCYLAGYFVRPLYAISKIYATPSWALYSIASCCLVFAVVHWLVEIHERKNWASFLKPAGVNPLLTYILPFIFYAIAGFSYLPEVLNVGILGFIRSVVFSLFILWVASLLTNRGVRLKL
jgi:hypothetical protein